MGVALHMARCEIMRDLPAAACNAAHRCGAARMARYIATGVLALVARGLPEQKGVKERPRDGAALTGLPPPLRPTRDVP